MKRFNIPLGRRDIKLLAELNRRGLELPYIEQWTHPETGESIVQFTKRKAKQHVKDDAPYLMAVGEQMSFDFDNDEGE